jgi:hypothetical protein
MATYDFTQEEIHLLHQPDIFRVKANIVHKWTQRLEKLQKYLAGEALQAQYTPWRDAGFRISRGEQYQQCPYAVADGPAIFQKTDLLAYRVICRWGADTGFTLLLKGRFWEALREKVNAALRESLDQANDLYLCVADTPWEHHFGADNYQALDTSLLADDSLWAQDFIKMAFSQPMDVSEEALLEKGLRAWRFFDALLAGAAPLRV